MIEVTNIDMVTVVVPQDFTVFAKSHGVHRVP